MFFSLLMSSKDLKLDPGVILIIAVVMPGDSMFKVVQISQKLSLWSSLVQILVLERLVLMQILSELLLLLFFNILNSLSFLNLLLLLLHSEPLYFVLNA